MAERFIYIPDIKNKPFVLEKKISFKWNPGFAFVQKQKNVTALHESAQKEGYKKVLEISSKSFSKLGISLSAFNLCYPLFVNRLIPIECVFQGSKVFEFGGPYTDIYDKSSKEAKKDLRLKNNGKLIAFQLNEKRFPLEPKTGFYDWIFMKALNNLPLSDKESLLEYSAFSDTEFNPKKSINCQARSVALFVSLLKQKVEIETDFQIFINKYYNQSLKKNQLKLF